jgi:hypothetical protein
MPDNLFANTPAAAVAKTTISFTAAGLDSNNIRIIFLVGNPLKSWDPLRSINPVTEFEVQKGYYIVPKANLDLSDVLIPPIPVIEEDPELSTPGNFEVSQTGADYINVVWDVVLDADSYELRIGSGINPDAATVVDTPINGQGSATGLISGQVYYLFVRATGVGYSPSPWATLSEQTLEELGEG